MPVNYKFLSSLFVFLILCYFSLFHQLGKQPMYMWDESSYALNAQEMIERNNPIELYLLGKPDLYNSKPPFAIWCMAVCIKLIGFNEVGARMASATFAFFSALLLWVIGIKAVRNFWLALLFPSVLLSSFGFVGWHIARTGDTDSILAFWIFLQSALILSYTNTQSIKRERLYLILFGVTFSLGCLTKGIAGITALPGIMCWLFYKGKLVKTFQNKGFYISATLFLILVVGYYYLRNYLTPGYFEAVLNNEIGGRLERQDFLNQKTLPFYFYLKYMYTQNRFLGWVIILPLSIVYIITRRSDNMKNVGIFFIFIFFSISTLLAISQTKLEWYDAPLYPVMSVIIGVAFCMLIEQTNKAVILVYICIFCWPFCKILSNNMDVVKGTHLKTFLKDLRNHGHKNDSIHIINSNANFSLFFYSKKDCLMGNYNDVITQDDSSLTIGSYILTQQYESDVDVNRLFLLQPILSYEECKYYKILGRK